MVWHAVSDVDRNLVDVVGRRENEVLICKRLVQQDSSLRKINCHTRCTILT